MSIFPKVASSENGGGSVITQAMAIGQRVAEHLAHVIDVIEAATERDQYRRFVLADVADAAGNCVLRFEGAVDRDFELITYAAACGTANQAFSIYHSEVNDRNLIYSRNNPTAKFGDNFGGGEFLPDGTALVVVFAGQAPGSSCTFTCRAKVLPRDPAYTPRARASGGGFLPGELLAMPDTAEGAPTEGMTRRLHGGG